MNKTSIAVVLAALVLSVPTVGFAQSSTSKAASTSAAPAAKKSTTSAVHATKGVVKSIDGSMLVITKVAGKGPETSFIVNSTTQRQGTVAPGSSVDVRYRTEGKDKVATAIAVQEMKTPPAKTATKASTTTTTKKP